jgi:hypothetical protein
MSRSKGFWEGSATNQSRGNAPSLGRQHLCDSLASREHLRLHSLTAQGGLGLVLGPLRIASSPVRRRAGDPGRQGAPELADDRLQAVGPVAVFVQQHLRVPEWLGTTPLVVRRLRSAAISVSAASRRSCTALSAPSPRRRTGQKCRSTKRSQSLRRATVSGTRSPPDVVGLGATWSPYTRHGDPAWTQTNCTSGGVPSGRQRRT